MQIFLPFLTALAHWTQLDEETILLKINILEFTKYYFPACNNTVWLLIFLLKKVNGKFLVVLNVFLRLRLAVKIRYMENRRGYKELLVQDEKSILVYSAHINETPPTKQQLKSYRTNGDQIAAKSADRLHLSTLLSDDDGCIS